MDNISNKAKAVDDLIAAIDIVKAIENSNDFRFSELNERIRWVLNYATLMKDKKEPVDDGWVSRQTRYARETSDLISEWARNEFRENDKRRFPGHYK
jgi:hypothetical protein